MILLSGTGRLFQRIFSFSTGMEASVDRELFRLWIEVVGESEGRTRLRGGLRLLVRVTV